VRADGADAEAWRALVRHLSARGAHDEARRALGQWDAAEPLGATPAAERARAELAAGCPEAALDAVAVARARGGDRGCAAAALDVLAARAEYQRGDAPAALACSIAPAWWPRATPTPSCCAASCSVRSATVPRRRRRAPAPPLSTRRSRAWTAR
jgi:hypothetical protein